MRRTLLATTALAAPTRAICVAFLSIELKHRLARGFMAQNLSKASPQA